MIFFSLEIVTVDSLNTFRRRRQRSYCISGALRESLARQLLFFLILTVCVCVGSRMCV